MAVQCSAIAKSGARCTVAVLPGSAYCWTHDPAAAEARREASRKGGYARSNQARAAKALPPAYTVSELIAVLSGGIRDVQDGTLEPGVLNAMSTAAKAIATLHEQSVLEERIAHLEAAAGLGERWRVS